MSSTIDLKEICQIYTGHSESPNLTKHNSHTQFLECPQIQFEKEKPIERLVFYIHFSVLGLWQTLDYQNKLSICLQTLFLF